ncbi:formylmethanofuran dehydrogenase subunit C [Candidatus Nitrosacidococcus tergens]|uniref:Formylmethanofuran dehydrogenase, subunit C n=1 Tax=Candidatus Nitrosacidococcus tergens TaxID=553981 RepID=A0A7G1Q752_9GAMM|nr:formylmethanofuran dehydrogenase subunit C [Candidatus Nitrosacidococcus tergens]CAB1274105.1 Formylmethanofuran dehydrogenase, subunit C [Candidatus Nitrosacidococcus tergens]
MKTTPLTFTLDNPPSQRIDVSFLIPKNLSHLSLAEIKAYLLYVDNQKIRIGELFNINGNDINHIIFSGQTQKLDYIGKNLSSGQITIQGSCGFYSGMGMSGGEIIVYGNTDSFAACEMKNGLLKIYGNCNDFLGAAAPNNRIGMSGGIVVVKGNSGDRVGDQMRRGTLLIEGDTGDYLGSRMIAGTIAILGGTGSYIGYGMKRGTLLLWQKPNKLSATFNDCGVHNLEFLSFMLNSYKKLDTQFSNPEMIIHRVHRFCGDMACLGQGEILIKQT